MIKELYQNIIKETALNVTQTKIDSVRKKNITKSGCRIYDNGYIGVAGTFGEPTEDTWQQAINNLSLKIPYEYEPEKNKKRNQDLKKLDISVDKFIEITENILAILRKDYPQFTFSNKVKLIEETMILKNDAGLDYRSSDKFVEFVILFKHINSLSIFDSFILYSGRTYNVDAIMEEARKQLDVFEKNVDLPDCGKLPIIFRFNDSITLRMIESLEEMTIAENSSMFSGKVGSKLFNDEFTLYNDMSDNVLNKPFFDAEGTVLENDKFALIENGVLVQGYSNKKTSKLYNVKNTASAYAKYDDIPKVEAMMLSPKCSDKTLKELIANKTAIYVVVMSGGDTTNEGLFASPVQSSYLVENGNIVGKLPEFNVSANIYDMFGKDYIGYSSDKCYAGDNALVVNMNISK